MTGPEPAVPPQAITAAEKAVRFVFMAAAGGRRPSSIDLATAAVEAAAPHLEAAARERCAQLAEQHGLTYIAACDDPDCHGAHHMAVPFAALLRQGGEGGGTR